MSFLRHEEIYRSDVRLGQSWERQPVSSLPVLIGCDEFPVGYSLAGCPPAEPASASPTGNDSQQPTLPYNDFSANGNNPLNFVSQPKGALQGQVWVRAPRRAIDRRPYLAAAISGMEQEPLAPPNCQVEPGALWGKAGTESPGMKTHVKKRCTASAARGK